MPGKNIKAFLDANTIISGLLFHGNEATLLELGHVRAIKLVTNRYVMSKVKAVHNRKEFSLTPEEITGLTQYIHECLTVIENPPNEQVQKKMNLLEDKKDIPVALGALNPEIDYLVTGDKELLDTESLPSITTKKLLKKILPESQ
ncbi:MAG: PIN domain-containing protein [Candidatus Bathyarchaeota archaeon]|nr:PIN domain-containing protein [Candidatus Bathyarchaeota archaeon]